MKTLAPILATLTGFAFAVDPPKDPITFTTTDQKSYVDVQVTKIYPDSIQVMSSSGIARIPFERLPTELQEQFEFDPETAKAARQAEQKRLAAMYAARLEQQNQNLRVQAALRRKKRYWEEAKLLNFSISQVLDDGCLIYRVSTSDGISYSGTHYIELPGGSDSYSNIYDDARIEAYAVAMKEPYRYTSILGAEKTVKRWLFLDPEKKPANF